MAVDLSVLDGQKTIIDQLQLQEAFELKKALAIQGAQRSALEMQALQSQAANGGLSLKDMMSFQIQQQNNAANQDIRREGLAVRTDMAEQARQAARQAMQDVLNEKNNEKLDKLNRGKATFEDSLASIAEQYKKLKDGDGISSVKDGWGSNAITGLQTSYLGQGVGGLLGTENQSARNQIGSTVPLLTNAIKEATGMSAQQMNSNIELQTFLKALGNPDKDYEANMGIVGNLSRKFGTGEIAQALGNKSPVANFAAPSATLEELLAEKARRGAGQ